MTESVVEMMPAATTRGAPDQLVRLVNMLGVSPRAGSRRLKEALARSQTSILVRQAKTQPELPPASRRNPGGRHHRLSRTGIAQRNAVRRWVAGLSSAGQLTAHPGAEWAG